MPAKVQHRQAKNESSIGFIFSPQMENPKMDSQKPRSKLSPLKVGHNWTTQKPKLDFDC